MSTYTKSIIDNILVKTADSQYMHNKIVHILASALKGFLDHSCLMRAPAMTFYTILSIVPLIAIVFGIAKGFGFEKILQEQLFKLLYDYESLASRMMESATTLLNTTRGGIIAGVGLIFLLWSVFKLLNTIENTVNDIWSVKKPRSLNRKIADYIAFMIICPALLIFSNAAIVLLASEVGNFISQSPTFSTIRPLVAISSEFVPFLCIYTLFMFVYMFMPNTKVNILSALFAGIIAGTFYILFHIIYIKFQIGISRANAIYGSFAALPLFFIWLQGSWLIMLFGVELTCAHQRFLSVKNLLSKANYISRFTEKVIALKIMVALTKEFISEPCSPKGIRWIASETGILPDYIEYVIEILRNAGLVSVVVVDDEQDILYQLGADPSTFSVGKLIEKFDNAIPKQADTTAYNYSLKNISESSEGYYIRKLYDVLKKEAPGKNLIEEFVKIS